MVHQSVRGAIEAIGPACGPSVPYHDARGGLCRGGFGQADPRDRLVVDCESLAADGKAARFQPGAPGDLDAMGGHAHRTACLLPVECRQPVLNFGTDRPGQRRLQHDAVVDGGQ
jgi:hypothetical protein